MFQTMIIGDFLCGDFYLIDCIINILNGNQFDIILSNLQKKIDQQYKVRPSLSNLKKMAVKQLNIYIHKNFSGRTINLKCPVCSKKYILKDLRKHLKIVHKINVKKKLHTCPWCVQYDWNQQKVDQYVHGINCLRIRLNQEYKNQVRKKMTKKIRKYEPLFCCNLSDSVDYCRENVQIIKIHSLVLNELELAVESFFNETQNDEAKKKQQRKLVHQNFLEPLLTSLFEYCKTILSTENVKFYTSLFQNLFYLNTDEFIILQTLQNHIIDLCNATYVFQNTLATILKISQDIFYDPKKIKTPEECNTKKSEWLEILQNFQPHITMIPIFENIKSIMYALTAENNEFYKEYFATTIQLYKNQIDVLSSCIQRLQTIHNILKIYYTFFKEVE